MIRPAQILDKWKAISPRFAPEEIFSPDTFGAFHLIDVTFLHLLNAFCQKHFSGYPCFVNTGPHNLRGVRSPREQIRLQGNTPWAADLSLHVAGKAADLSVAGHTPDEVADLAIEFGFHGIGVYPTFVHLDLRTLTSPKPVVFERN